MSQLVELVPAVSPTVAGADDNILARIALWLADVSADAALAALDGQAYSPAQQPASE
jgi:hypothetical protein